MKTFHNDQKIKDKYVKRLKAHYDADEIIKGAYWENGKGCAVGCTLHSDDHKAYETELGIPESLARLKDSIFEALPHQEAKQFPLDFLNAVNVGSDLSGVTDKFVHWLLVDPEHGVIKFTKNKKVVQDVADLYQRKINGETVERSEWQEVARAARTADYASVARDAAYTAYNAAYAYVARADVYDAACAADAAYTYAVCAYADRADVYDASRASRAASRAYNAARTAPAKKLIELISHTIT